MTTPSLRELGGERKIGANDTYYINIFSPPATHHHRCCSCGIQSSTAGLCIKCSAYHELGHAVAQLSGVMRTLELFGAHDPIPELPVRVCDLPEPGEGEL